MIKTIEIKEAARAWGLRQDIVEKDYVLGWFLIGLSTHPRVRTEWVFKGGTCLKKCYIETYRFSEDLDFTLVPGASREESEITRWLADVCNTVSRESGIEFPSELIEISAYPNPRGSVTFRGKVGYRGPLEPPRLPKIRLDLTTDEVLVRPPILRPIHHPYSDAPATVARFHCYAIEEILAEKTRAMADRGLPRDLYDIIRLFRHEGFRLDAATTRSILAEKCAQRGFPFPTMAQLAAAPSRAELESEWANMLAHQLPALPPLEPLWAALEEYFTWLEGKSLPDLAPVAETEPRDATWRPPDYMSLPAEWGVTTSVEAIRFAGANHLCVELDYRPEKGTSGVRQVEPYSFRRSRRGYLVLYGRNVTRPRITAYRVDRIARVRVTTKPFLPRWQVEL